MTSPLDPFNLAGIAGTAILVGAYFGNQRAWLRSEGRLYSLANGIGSGLILVSLSVDWNLPSAIVEAIWLAISLYGLVRPRKPRPQGLT
jgi:hypothetical protein